MLIVSESTISFQINGVPLIKFQSEDRIQQLRNGKLYAKTLGYYRKLEEITGDKEIGDAFEAMVHINEGIIRFPDTGKEIILNDELISTLHSEDYVFCMFGIYPQLDNFNFSEKQKEKMLSFGDTALVILDSEAFIERVKSAAEKAGFRAYFSGVKYYDETFDNANMIIDLMKGMYNVAFWKRKSYAYQQEGRFIFIAENSNDSDHIILDIGDISDITRVFPSKQILTGVVTKSGNEHISITE